MDRPAPPPSLSSSPSPSPHHVLLSLSVTGATHFRDVTFDFRDGLNCILGGRGAGKSGVLLLIRFALGAFVPALYAEEVDDYVRATLGSGRATVAFRTQHGVHYTASRACGTAPVVCGENGEAVSVSLDGDLFKIDAYVQNEIEGIAKSPEAQLALLGKFAEPQIRAIDEAVQRLDRKIAQVGSNLRRLTSEIADEAAREAELPSVTEALKGIDLGSASAPGDAAAAERAKAHEARVQRGRERAAMAALSGELGTFRSALDAFAHDALQKLARAVEGDLERGAHGEVFRHTHAAMQRMAGAVEGAAGRLRTELAAVEQTTVAEGRVLAAAHAKEDEAYQALVLRDDADRVRAAESTRLHKKLEELSAVAKRLGDRRREQGATRHEWDALLAERARLYAEKSAHLKRVGEELTAVLAPEIRVTVTPGDNHKPFAALLGDVLKGANIRPASFIDTIAQRIPPSVLVALVEANDIEPIMDLDPAKSGKEERAKKILSILRTSDRLFEIALARLEDTPHIELKVGAGYRPSAKVSTGQRCTCILPILLLLSGAPLLIDQVEDNLDSSFIYKVLVKRIAEVARMRQLLVVTHNPNPPTLANASQILWLETDAEGRGVLGAAGTFEEVRGHVERTEGGREAFVRRGERYGLIPPQGGGRGDGGEQ